MKSIDASLFWKAVICGILATFVMTMMGFRQAGIGLPKIDVGGMLTKDMTSAHPDNLLAFLRERGLFHERSHVGVDLGRLS